MSDPVRIVIVGGGTAGWMFAAALAHQCSNNSYRTVLIESDEIGTIGVGEATLPQIKNFNDFIGVNETDMLQATNATFKLGIEFVDWGFKGSSYIHPFGTFGDKPGGVDFLQHWVRARQSGKPDALENYSYAIQACRQNRFAFPEKDSAKIESTFSYAYHLDASAYAKYLRHKFEGKNLTRIEGKVTQVIQDKNTGNINAVQLESGDNVSGDYFIDCTGFRSLLLGDTLKVPFEDWSECLPCDRAVAIPSKNTGELRPYTRSTAQSAGWQWNIPLQHRTGNGYVYCSEFISDDEAAAQLSQNIATEALAEPNFIRFKAGRRQFSWFKNCIAAGLSGGFLEPLESTSLFLIQEAVTRFIALLPGKQPNAILIDEYNRIMDLQYEKVKDFLILHYHLGSRNDTAFWRYCRAMNIPDSLQYKIDLFQRRGYIEQYDLGLFSPPSWISVFVGQGLIPNSYHPCIENASLTQSQEKLRNIASTINNSVKMMPTHDTFIKNFGMRVKQ